MDGFVNEKQIAQLEAEVASLRERLDRLERNGLNNFYFRNIFADTGGLYGTENQAARVDHSH